MMNYLEAKKIMSAYNDLVIHLETTEKEIKKLNTIKEILTIENVRMSIGVKEDEVIRCKELIIRDPHLFQTYLKDYIEMRLKHLDAYCTELKSRLAEYGVEEE